MDYDFVVDTSKLTSLTEIIAENSEGISGVQENVESEVTTIQSDESWDGDTYQLFSEKTGEYRDELNAMVEYMNKYSEVLTEVISQAGTLDQAIIEACNIGG